MRSIVNIIIPKNSTRRELFKSIYYTVFKKPPDPYNSWRNEQYSKIVLYPSLHFDSNPLISIVVPAFNTPDRYLTPLIYSVVGQVYQNWELVLVNASTEEGPSERIKNCKAVDDRIRIINVENKGISENTNVGIKAASGEYIAFMDHDDVLELNALQEVVKVINEEPKADLIYTDEDKLTEDGSKCRNPHYKPDWSPHLLTHVNYITHFVVVKKEYIEKTGGLDSKRDGAQDFDLLLKLTDLDIGVKHIPKILYHWREAINSTAADISNKPYVLEAGENSLRDHYKRKKINASVKAIESMPGFYRVKYQPSYSTTIIITPFANETLIRKYTEILLQTSYLDNYKIITPFSVLDDDRLTIVKEAKPQAYLEHALKESSEYVVIVSDFVLPLYADWANDLTGLLEDNRVHSAAPAVIKSDTTIIDMGLVSYNMVKNFLFRGYRFGETTPFGDTTWPRNIDELSGRIIAARKKEISKYIEEHQAEELLLNGFSASKGEDMQNIVWSNTVMVHAKVSLPPHKYNPSFFNQSFYDYKGDMHTFANEQQLLDALIQVEKDVVERANNGQ